MKPLSLPAAPRSRCARPRACSPAARSAPTIAARRRAGRADLRARAGHRRRPHGARAERMVARAQRSPARRPDHRRARVQPRSACCAGRLRASRAQLAQQRAAQLPKSSATVAAIRTREPDVSALGSLLPSNGSNPSGGTSPSLGGSAAAALFGRLRRNLGNRPVRRHAPRGRSGICASGSGRRRSRRHAGVDRCRSRQRVHRPARSTAAACAVAAHCRAAAEDARPRSSVERVALPPMPTSNA